MPAAQSTLLGFEGVSMNQSLLSRLRFRVRNHSLGVQGYEEGNANAVNPDVLV